MSVKIQPATSEDAHRIADLVALFAARGQILPRSEADIEASLGDWIVAKHDGRVVGCGSLLRYTDRLSEIRSLVVAERFQGRGVGAAIVEELIATARERGIDTLFTLTRATGFFERRGFQGTSRDSFPEKVWRDCALCPIQDHCDEEAMALSLDGFHGAPRQTKKKARSV